MRKNSFLASFVFAAYSLVISIHAFSQGVMQEWSRRHAFVDPQKTQESILDTWQGGNWGGKALSGQFRFFVTQSKNSAANNLYIQWLKSQEETEEVFYSVSIDELNSLPRYRFGLPRCAQENCQEIKILAFDIFEEKELEFKMVLEGVGQYRIKI